MCWLYLAAQLGGVDSPRLPHQIANFHSGGINHHNDCNPKRRGSHSGTRAGAVSTPKAVLPKPRAGEPWLAVKVLSFRGGGSSSPLPGGKWEFLEEQPFCV